MTDTISMRGRAFVRLFLELESLQAARGGLTVAQLAAEHGVSGRTIRRDLRVLWAAGVVLAACVDESTEDLRWRVLDARITGRAPVGLVGAR